MMAQTGLYWLCLISACFKAFSDPASFWFKKQGLAQALVLVKVSCPYQPQSCFQNGKPNWTRNREGMIKELGLKKKKKKSFGATDLSSRWQKCISTVLTRDSYAQNMLSSLLLSMLYFIGQNRFLPSAVFKAMHKISNLHWGKTWNKNKSTIVGDYRWSPKEIF